MISFWSQQKFLAPTFILLTLIYTSSDAWAVTKKKKPNKSITLAHKLSSTTFAVNALGVQFRLNEKIFWNGNTLGIIVAIHEGNYVALRVGNDDLELKTHVNALKKRVAGVYGYAVGERVFVPPTHVSNLSGVGIILQMYSDGEVYVEGYGRSTIYDIGKPVTEYGDATPGLQVWVSRANPYDYDFYGHIQEVYSNGTLAVLDSARGGTKFVSFERAHHPSDGTPLAPPCAKYLQR